MFRPTRAAAFLVFVAAMLGAPSAHAFGDKGHEIIAAIAERYLRPEVRTRVFALLASDNSRLTTATDIVSEATWADHYRDSNPQRKQQTRHWHFVDIQIKAPSISAACPRHSASTATAPIAAAASNGPEQDCIIDKITQFERELASPTTSRPERLLALQFLLHFVGDVHQPLHAGDDHDHGGNDKVVRAPGKPTAALHHYWDTVFVESLGRDPRTVAQLLIADITPRDRGTWSQGTAADWALDTFQSARDVAYRRLPVAKQGVYNLDASYVFAATQLTSRQLRKAGVRLAALLNRSVSP